MDFKKIIAAAAVLVMVSALFVSISSASPADGVTMESDTTSLGDSGVPTLSDEDLTNDPLIQGNFGIGTTFTYDVVDAYVHDDDGTYTLTTGSTMTVTVVGESGSYYFVLVDSSYTVRYGSGMISASITPAMIHKQTGELRFSSSVGSDSIVYNGDTISLEKWEWRNNTPNYDGSQYDILTFSSDPDDAIPYKVERTMMRFTGPSASVVFTVSFELTDYDIVPADEPFVPSEGLGEGLVYSMIIISNVGEVTAELTIMIAADGEFEGDRVRFALYYIWIFPNEETYSEYGVILFMPLPEGITAAEAVYAMPLIELSGEVLIDSGTEVLSTIDGDILCDVLTYDYGFPGSAVIVRYVGPDGLLYLQQQYVDGDVDVDQRLDRRISADYTVAEPPVVVDGDVLVKYPPTRTDTSYEVPSTVTSIGDGAFAGCVNLESVSIPSSVTEIGDGAFAGCTGLKTISIPAGVDIENAGIPEGVIVIFYEFVSGSTSGGTLGAGADDVMSVLPSLNDGVVSIIIKASGKTVSSVTATGASGSIAVTGDGDTWTFSPGTETKVNLTITLSGAAAGTGSNVAEMVVVAVLAVLAAVIGIAVLVSAKRP